jgi:hypothetical protein
LATSVHATILAQKNSPYRYEQELRFVFGIHPSLETGISIEIDSSELIFGVSSAPDIPKEEGPLLINVIRSNQLPNVEYPAECKIEWLVQYKKIGGSPFTMVDEPAGLYPDLDRLDLKVE